MDVERLRQTKARAVYVMPSHQFPTGTVMPIGRRMELLRWAAREPERYLIEDDYDSEFRFRGKPIPALQASDRHGRVIYLGTFSKAIAPAIRVSFLVLPESLLEKYLRECGFYSCTVSRIDQSILDEFIREGYFERHLNKMRKIYRAKHELLLNLLQPFREEFDISGENAGLHLVLTSRGGSAERELVRRAAEQGVRVYGLSESMVEEAPDSASVLLGFGGLSGAAIQEGMERLGQAWKQ
jgi:GntR family transcriptional regulator/MocR family aminotransferase